MRHAWLLRTKASGPECTVGASGRRWAVAPSLEMLMEPSQIDPSRDKAAHMKQARTLIPQAARRARCGAASPEEGEQRGGAPAALQAGARGSVGMEDRRAAWVAFVHTLTRECMVEPGRRGVCCGCQGQGQQRTEMSAPARAAQRRQQGAAFTPEAMDSYLPRVEATCRGYLARWSRQDAVSVQDEVRRALGATQHTGPGQTLGQTLK